MGEIRDVRLPRHLSEELENRPVFGPFVQTILFAEFGVIPCAVWLSKIRRITQPTVPSTFKLSTVSARIIIDSAIHFADRTALSKRSHINLNLITTYSRTNMSTTTTHVEKLSINTIRTLSMDAVQKANSGHPGTPMALAPAAYVLWQKHLDFDPENPHWIGRDRFVLSCGHASMLIYSMLHLGGVRKVDHSGQPLSEPAVGIEDIKNFRQLHSVCAGHPEFGFAPGIETTTGPLGQGVANSVGMAIASRFLSARFAQNRPELFDFNVYALCSDGDLMEGVALEAASVAGHQQLSNLCWIYDDNHITIEGHTDLAFSEDTASKYQALGWNTITVDDANDVDAIDNALRGFKSESSRPTLIVLKSIIGFGAPTKQDSHDAHGAPLGEDEILGAKKYYEWDAEKFDVPPEVMEHFAEEFGARGNQKYAEWKSIFDGFQKEFPEKAADIHLMENNELPTEWESCLPVFEADAKGMATRVSSGKVLNAIAKVVPWMMGGSADLAGSNKSDISGEESFLPNSPAGRNMHFGIREHAMAAICNGMSLSHLRAYGATFFVFTDYMRPSMRLASLMKQNVFYILTHDSIGLGEDGPTHQPVEHLAACRGIPGLVVIRPCDANEVSEAYRAILNSKNRPVALVLTRQNLPTLDRNQYGCATGVGKGAYVLKDCENPDVILMGSGSEVAIAIKAAEKLASRSVAARVVSVPSWELFEDQDASYREQVLPRTVKARVAVEAGIQQGWGRYIGDCGQFVGMSSFGESAPFEQLYEHFGITADKVVEAAERSMADTKQ